MAKFEVLHSNHRIISLTCGIDIKENSKLTSVTRKFFTSIPVYLILFILTNILLSCAVKTSNKSYDFTARLTAASIIIALCQGITIFLNIGVNMQKMAALNQTLQAIADGEGDLLLNFNIRFYSNIFFFFNFLFS